MTDPDMLRAALASHAVQRQDDRELTDPMVEQLCRYCDLLWQWNDKLNLTRHDSLDLFVTRDLVDTFHLSKLIEPDESVLDVGTGGGVPGIPLAIIRPDLQLSLCESVAKKTAALDDIILKLDLPIRLFQGRGEHVLEQFEFDVLVARAVGPLWKIGTWFAPHWPKIGRLLAIKGPKWVEERGEARHRGTLRDVELRCAAKYPMPGTDSESVILKLWGKDAS